MKIPSAALGLIAMAASPFLFVEMYMLGNKDQNTSVGGVCDLIYMIGWVCSIVGMLRLQATGQQTSGKMILYIQLASLGIANVWNIWTIIDPASSSILYFILDFFWPLSNVCLLAVGIVIAVKGRLAGWKRYVPLMAGLWLPVSIVTALLFGPNEGAFLFSGMYSTATWFVMGYMIYISERDKQLVLSKTMWTLD